MRCIGRRALARIAPTGVRAVDFVRRNVWELGGDWADEVLWYARGVAAMQSRALAEPTSWRFYAAMHGFNPARWQELGYLTAADEPPSQALMIQFWRQCQHGSWYFLPWHRGYVLALEANIRAIVLAAGGPSEWALPYWDYLGPGPGRRCRRRLRPRTGPTARGTTLSSWSIATGRLGTGTCSSRQTTVNLTALGDPDFTGVSSGGSTGFGGVDTGFSHGGSRPRWHRDAAPRRRAHGHRRHEGTAAETTEGVMSRPELGGARPDLLAPPRQHRPPVGRLEGVRPQTHRPDVQQAMAAGTGQQRPAGVLRADARGHHLDVHARRDDGPRRPRTTPTKTCTPPVPAVPVRRRLDRLGIDISARGGAPVPEESNVELVGANDHPVPLRGQ